MKDMQTKTLEINDFEIKAEGDDLGIFTGYGATFGGEPDSHGDIVEAGAFAETLMKGGRNGNGVAMLWNHNFQRPIGTWLEISEDSKGLRVKGQLAVKATDGKDVFELMLIGAVKGLSFGYDVLDYEVDTEKEIRILKKVTLWEISPVTFPANINATITGVKSLIESATDERMLEKGLREAGLSHSASKYIVSLCKDKLFEKISEKKENSLDLIYKELSNLSEELKNIKIKKD